ncbi:MAG TPA: HAMP domain-containing sensor histidine kinase [Oxalicibacterium sp.]|nr:HAMP domain-containing sensor histidine kinase [Oxalicibacterium sp.]
MSKVSDQASDAEKLSQTSRKMLELRDAVLLQCEHKLRERIEQARNVSHPILIDTIPLFYENIAKALTPECARRNGIESTSIAHEHGGERARLTTYDPLAIIIEFQVFRETIFDVLHQGGVALDHREIAIINNSIDTALTEAINTFSMVRAALREQFLAALTHDLRNPLHSARVTSEMILRLDDPCKMKALAARIIGNLQRMDGMIQSLLDSMLFESGERLQLKLRHFDLLETVNEVVEECAIRHGPRFEVRGGTVTGWWDREALKRALENVLGNAVKYGHPHTPVLIKLEEVEGRVLISVHNEGDPIPPEEQEGIFQVFRRTASAKGSENRGWGIGLPYVRGVTESHGGSIVVDSAAERGTTFVIDIPLDARPFRNAPTLQPVR